MGMRWGGNSCFPHGAVSWGILSVSPGQAGGLSPVLPSQTALPWTWAEPGRLPENPQITPGISFRQGCEVPFLPWVPLQQNSRLTCSVLPFGVPEGTPAPQPHAAEPKLTKPNGQLSSWVSLSCSTWGKITVFAKIPFPLSF